MMMVQRLNWITGRFLVPVGTTNLPLFRSRQPTMSVSGSTLIKVAGKRTSMERSTMAHLYVSNSGMQPIRRRIFRSDRQTEIIIPFAYVVSPQLATTFISFIFNTKHAPGIALQLHTKTPTLNLKSRSLLPSFFISHH